MSTPHDRPPARRRYTGLVGAVLVTALLAVWVWLVGVRSVQLIATGRAVGIALGTAFLVLPLLVIALIVREWLLAVDVQRMADELDRAGELPVDDLPRSPGGRVDRHPGGGVVVAAEEATDRRQGVVAERPPRVRHQRHLPLEELELLPTLLREPTGLRRLGEAGRPQPPEEVVDGRGVGRCRPPHRHPPADHGPGARQAAGEGRF